MSGEIRRVQEKKQSYERLFIEDATGYLLSLPDRCTTEEQWQERFKRFYEEAAGSFRHTGALMLAEALSAKVKLPKLRESGILPKKPSFCHPQNRFAAQAAERLNMNAHWFYTEDYSTGCAEVFSGLRDGCILPFLGAEGNVMPGMARLAEESELKKYRVIYLDTPQQRAGYLLLTKVLPEEETEEAPSQPEENGGSGELTAEILALPKNRGELLEGLALLQEASCRYHLVRTPGGYDFENHFEAEDSLYATLVLKADRKRLKELIFALRLLLENCTVTGFYKTIYSD